MGLRLQSVIRMKLLVLLAFVALAQAEAQPDAVAAPEADADALLYHPYYNYGYYGFPRYVFGRKRREAEADAGLYRYHYPYFNYGYHGFPRYVFGRKRRDAEAAPEADAHAGYHGYYPHYGYGRYYGHYLDKQCVWRKILSDTLNSLS